MQLHSHLFETLNGFFEVHRKNLVDGYTHSVPIHISAFEDFVASVFNGCPRQEAYLKFCSFVIPNGDPEVEMVFEVITELATIETARVSSSPLKNLSANLVKRVLNPGFALLVIEVVTLFCEYLIFCCPDLRCRLAISGVAKDIRDCLLVLPVGDELPWILEVIFSCFCLQSRDPASHIEDRKSLLDDANDILMQLEDESVLPLLRIELIRNRMAIDLTENDIKELKSILEHSRTFPVPTKTLVRAEIISTIIPLFRYEDGDRAQIYITTGLYHILLTHYRSLPKTNWSQLLFSSAVITCSPHRHPLHAITLLESINWNEIHCWEGRENTISFSRIREALDVARYAMNSRDKVLGFETEKPPLLSTPSPYDHTPDQIREKVQQNTEIPPRIININDFVAALLQV